MNDRPNLTEAEWELIVELLQREQNELPTEIHHTRSSSLRDELRARRKRVDGLLQRLTSPAVV